MPRTKCLFFSSILLAHVTLYTCLSILYIHGICFGHVLILKTKIVLYILICVFLFSCNNNWWNHFKSTWIVIPCNSFINYMSEIQNHLLNHSLIKGHLPFLQFFITMNIQWYISSMYIYRYNLWTAGTSVRDRPWTALS